jgi:IS605 OrfB family transposase
MILERSKLDSGEKRDEILNKIINEGKNYDKLLNFRNESLIDLEIKRHNDTIVKHKEVMEKIMQKNKNSHYEKRIKKLIKMIENNRAKIITLEKIKENEKEKQKYEKYLWYLKKNKVDHYNRKIKNKINELHWQTATEIARENETIILGKINSKNIMMKNDINKATKRVLQSLSHYSFREKLVYKCLTYNRNIKIQNEKFTTKMCYLCGHYNEKVKGEKKIKCNGCKVEYDRDSGSAVNICLASLE